MSQGGYGQLVSVVLPTYGRPDLLERAIASVFGQTHRAWELLIVDDNDPGSEARERTEGLVGRYTGDGVVYLAHERNRGGGAARNTGVRAARGRYVAFLDDDDEWYPEKLELQLDRFATAPEGTAMVYCGFVKHYRHSGRRVTELPRDARHSFDDLLMRNTIGTTSAVLCLREAVSKVGLFDESLPSKQDIDLYLRLARRYRFEAVPEVLLTCHKHGGPSIGSNRSGVIRAHRIFYRKYRQEIDSRPAVKRHHLLSLARLHAQCGEFAKGRAMLLEAWFLSPLRPTPLALALLSNAYVARLRSGLSTLRYRLGNLPAVRRE